jgi:hypothetical protein
VKLNRVTSGSTRTDHLTAAARLQALPQSDSLSAAEALERIITLNQQLAGFWQGAEGWAAVSAAQLLTKSRLDRQVSLSHCLKLWLEKPAAEAQSGRLILAWGNLGSLVEGTLKLFLSVWYENYTQDIEAIKSKGKLHDPDGLQLEPLRNFFKRQVWDAEMDDWVKHIQQRRNAIHAYQDKDIGTYDEFYLYLRRYLDLLRYINFRLPYPDGIQPPQESAVPPGSA